MIRHAPYRYLRAGYATAAAATVAWLLHTVMNMPTQSADMIMPHTYPAVAALLAAAAVGLALSWRRMRVEATDITALLTAAWVAYTASYFDPEDPRYGEFAQCVMLYAALRIVFSAEHRTKNAVAAILFIVAVYESVTGIRQVFGLSQSYHGLFRITGTLFNPGPYAGMITAPAACAAAYAVIRYRDTGRLLGRWSRSPRPTALRIAADTGIYACACAAMVSTAVVLPATMSRAAWIAAGSSAALLSVLESPLPRRLKAYRSRHKLRAALLVLGVLSVIAAAGTGAYRVKRPSADGRMLMWRIDARIIGRNALHGVGMGNFAGAFGREQANYFASAERPESERSIAGCPEAGFNEYLQFGAETGVAGMAGLAATVLCAVMAGLRRRDPYAYGLAAMAVFAMFSYPFAVVPLRYIFIILLAASATGEAGGGRGTATAGCMWALALASCTVPWHTLYARSRDRAEACKAWQDTRLWLASERYDYMAEDGERLFGELKYDFRFLYDYGYALHKTGEYARSNEILRLGMERSSDPMFHNIAGKNFEATGDSGRAGECYMTAHDMIPSRIYPLYLAAMMYENLGMRDKAAETARRALRMRVKVESEQTRELRRELQELIDRDRQPDPHSHRCSRPPQAETDGSN